MFQNNPLLAQLKEQIRENIPKKEGTVKGTEKGFGFLEVDDKTSFFIPPPYMKKVMHGDRVVALIRTEKEREVAEPDELVEAGTERFIGRIKMFRDRLNVVPDHPQLKDSIKARPAKSLKEDNFGEGDWVVAKLTRHPLKGDNGFFCEITRLIAKADDHLAPWWVTLSRNDLPQKEPESTESFDMAEDGLNREDLTSLPFVTIDSPSTKDMDDALHAVQNADGSFTLTVAIADPTSYISVDSAMDKEARKRGFTIYLPGFNIPMLPRELSDDLCSLTEGDKRPALCAEIRIAADGTIAEGTRFFAAWITSHARLNYNDVSDWIETGICDNWSPDDVTAEQVKLLHGVAKARIQWRETHAVMFPDRPDYSFKLDENNDVAAIVVEPRRIANRIVEESMITANICAGRALRDHYGFGVYNTHAGFQPEKLADAVELVNANGFETDAENLQTLEGFSALRRWLNEQETTYLDNRLRKSQAFSEIQTEPAAHFAMGLDVYATWTSPIRKYGDMVNHRLLKGMIMAQEPVQTPDAEIGPELIIHRKNHRIAERDIADWLYSRYLQADKEAKTVFNGEIFDITRAGMRVRVLDNGAMAFVPASLIVDNKERIEANGENGTISVDGNVEFRLGDHIQLILHDVIEATRSIVGKPTREFAVVAEKVEAAEKPTPSQDDNA